MLVITSADYGDAYMRSGWASRFLFDLCRCKTIVLVGYSAGDAPVRYFSMFSKQIANAFPTYARSMRSTQLMRVLRRTIGGRR